MSGESSIDAERDVNFEPTEKKAHTNIDPYPGDEKKMEIVNYFRSGAKAKTLQQMQHRYRKLATLTTIYNWEKILSENGKS